MSLTQMYVANNYSTSSKKTDSNLQKYRCHVVLNDKTPVSLICFLDKV